jgi:ABC-type transport system involved in cytochrome c biogenesis permease subunit
MVITFLIAKIILGGYWLMFAPALFLPLGTLLFSAQVRRGIVEYLVLLLAVAFAALGVVVLLTLPLRDAVTTLAGILAIWCLAAAITLVARKGKQRRSQSQELRTARSSITR